MKFYKNNRLDQEFEAETENVARQFIQAVRDGYDISRCRASSEFAFHWWLGDVNGFASSWDIKDSEALMEALLTVASEEDRKLIWEKLMEGVS